MSGDAIADLVQRINEVDSPRAVVYAAGGGTEVFPMLLARGGGSATLLAARIPYDANDFRAILGCQPERLVDARSARGLAMAAFRHALTIRGELSPNQVFGLGATSKLSRGSGEREGRSHEIHAAVQTDRSTYSLSLTMPEGSDRAWEERINALVLLNLLAAGKGIKSQLPLEHEGRSIDRERVEHRVADSESCQHPGLPDLFTDRSLWVAYDPTADGHDRATSASESETPRLLLPGSFRPIHAGHIAMAEVASRLTGETCGFEISLFHPEKPPLDYVAIRSRLKGFQGLSGRLYLTHAPTYIEKARLFPGCTFAVGHDTALRIIDPRFYGGRAGRDAMLDEMKWLGVRLLIFGRVDASGKFRDFSEERFESPVAEFLARSATIVPGHVFRIDLSSTEMRDQSDEDFA